MRHKAELIAIEMAEEQIAAEYRWRLDFDRENTLNDWVTYVVRYLGDAASMFTEKSVRREKLIKAGGLIISAVKAMDEGYLKKRHFDDQGE